MRDNGSPFMNSCQRQVIKLVVVMTIRREGNRGCKNDCAHGDREGDVCQDVVPDADACDVDGCVGAYACVVESLHGCLSQVPLSLPDAFCDGDD